MRIPIAFMKACYEGECSIPHNIEIPIQRIFSVTEANDKAGTLKINLKQLLELCEPVDLI